MAPHAADSSRVYVAPFAASLDGFREICNNDNVRTGITELIFISNMLDEGFVGNIYDHLDDYMAAAESRYTYCVDPPKDLVLDTENMEKSFQFYEELRDHYTYDAKKTAAVLSQCLPKLPKLRKVIITPQIPAGEPGLNDDCCFSTKYKPNGEIDTVDLNLAERVAVELLKFNDAVVDKLIRAISKARVEITALEIGSNLKSHQYLYDLSGPWHPIDQSKFEGLAVKLTHLSIDVSNDHYESFPYKAMDNLWGNFLAAATNITELRICPGNECQNVEYGNVLGLVLRQSYPHLTRFEIINKFNRTTNVQAVALKVFAARHAQTLRHIRFSEVLLVNWYGPRAPLETKEAMGCVLRYLKEALHLKTAAITLYHQDAYKGKGQCDRCDKNYVWKKGNCVIPVQLLESLAKELQVPLIRGKWDFGEYLMR